MVTFFRPPSELNRAQYLGFFFSVLSLACVGLVTTIYLSLSHYWNYTDISYSSFCAISQAINCDTVAQSPWSVFLGIPVANWGLIGYLLFLAVLIPSGSQSREQSPRWALLLLMATVFSGVSIYFSYISATKINSYCILCLVCFAVNLALFVLCLFTWRRVKRDRLLPGILAGLKLLLNHKPTYAALTLIIGLTLCLQLFLPNYWLLDLPTQDDVIATGVTEDGHPWIGAASPKLVIEEYTDYQCFQCSKLHFMLRNLMAEHPDSIRLVHRHYPMDHEFNPTVVPEPFHVGSGKMALLAIYAMSRDKFWEMNDILYELGRSKKPFEISTLSERTGIDGAELAAALEYPPVRQRLKHDIRAGMKLRILGTPSFVIDEIVYTGTIPPEILDKVIDSGL